MNNYRSAFEPIRRSHDDVPVLKTGGRKTLPVGVGRDYSKELPEGEAIRSYATSTHLIDSEGQPTIPTRVEIKPSRRRFLVGGLAALAVATTGAVVGVKAAEPGAATGPDVTPLVHRIHDNENNPDPIQNPTQVTPAEGEQAPVATDNP